MDIYTYQPKIPILLGRRKMYFRLKESTRLYGYSEDHLRNSFKDTDIQKLVYRFLDNNSAKKRNSKTKRLKLLEEYDNIK